jgi:hypothetical protein
LNIEGTVVPPFTGNFTTSDQQFSNIVFNRETSTSLTLLQEYPWRKILMYMEVQKDEYLNCDLDFRLHSNVTYNLVIQGYFHESETLLYVYMNGKMLRKCTYTGQSFIKNSDSSNTMHYTLENKKDRVITHNQVVYWPRVLSYHEVQQISLPVSNSPAGLTSTRTWYSDAMLRYTNSSLADAAAATAATGTADQCVRESVAVILHPGVYSGKSTSRVFSVHWLQQHLLNSIQRTIDSLTLCENEESSGSVVIYVPLSSGHRELVESFLTAHLSRNPDVAITLELTTIPSSIKPLSQRSDNLTVTYSFAAVSNMVVREIDTSPTRADVKFIAFLNSHIYPEQGWLVGLLRGGGVGGGEARGDAIEGEGGVDVVGGKLVHMTGVLLHYGYELLELSFNGGLDVMLTPHNMYR